MSNPTTDVLTDAFLDANRITRKKLIPLWIKLFAWIFLVIGALTPLILVFGLITHNAALAIYGLETATVYSATGIIIIVLFLFKGITAYGIIKREEWAVNFALIDAVAGIFICIMLMSFPSLGNNQFAVRLELIALVPYLARMLKVKSLWRSAEQD